MPAILPALAGFGASAFFAGSFATMTGLTMLTSGIIVGAVAGAAVGGIQAAVTDGDIGEGILFGAVGGAAGGALGGIYTAGSFGAATTVQGVGAGEVVGGVGVSAEAITPAATKVAVGSAGQAAETGLLGLGLSEGGEAALIQGGMGLLEGFGGEEGPSAEEQHKYRIKEIEKEGEMADMVKAKEHQRIIDESAAERDRMRETATGLTLERRQVEQGERDARASLKDDVITDEWRGSILDTSEMKPEEYK